jgi:sporulation protein YlmC with PRC-barrel domain
VKTYKYYDRTPYWQSSDPASLEQKNRGAGGTYRDRWYERTTVWQKATDLCGKDAHNTKNEDIGRITDLAIDPDGGRVLYGILAYSSKLFAVPMNALALSNDGKKFVINVSKEELNSMTGFTSTNWPNMADREWATRAHAQFRADPYWNEPRIEPRNNP